MPNTQMKFYVDIPNFDSLTRQEKSFINFIMKHGALFINGEYDENTHELQHITGVIRLKSQTLNRVFYNTGYGWSWILRYNNYDVFIPYINQWVDNVDLYAGLPNFITQLSNVVNSSLSVYHICDGEYNNEYSVKKLLISPNVSVTITPKIGDTVNTDSRYLPVSLPYRCEYPELCEVPIDLTNTDYKSDFQLRTPTFAVDFGIKMTDSDDGSEYKTLSDEYEIRSEYFQIKNSSQQLYYITISTGNNIADEMVESGMRMSIYADNNTSETVFSFTASNGYHGECRDSFGSRLYISNYVPIFNNLESQVGGFYYNLCKKGAPYGGIDDIIINNSNELVTTSNIQVQNTQLYIKSADLHYKVGVFNVSVGEHNTSDIVSALIGNTFRIGNVGGSGYDSMVYLIDGGKDELCTNFEYPHFNSGIESCAMIYKSLVNASTYGIPNAMILPLGYKANDENLEAGETAYDKFNLVGFLYFELYDSNNKSFTENIDGVCGRDWKPYRKTEYGTKNEVYIYSDGAGMTLTDIGVSDGDFIYWEDIDNE